MNTDQLEAFVKYAASKGILCTLGIGGEGWLFTGIPEKNLNVCVFCRGATVDEAIRGGLEKLSLKTSAALEPAIWWRTLQIRQQIEQAEDTDMHMDFALTFELVRLGLRGLPELRGLIADTLRSVLQKTWTSDTEADLADALAAEDLPAFVNHVDGLLAWASTHGNAEQALGEALRGVP